MHHQKEAKAGQGEPGFPICKPLCRLAVLATDLDFSGEKNPNPYCAQIRSKGSHGASAPSALRCPKKSSRCSLARFFRPLRVLRLAASATGGARLRTPYPSPVAGEGPSGQIAAYSGLRLGSVTFCASLLGKSQSLPPCGARKNLRAARLLDFFDRYGCSASLHPPLAVLGSASPSTAPPLSRQDHITNPSVTSPVKSTIYVISTQHFPIM